MNNNYLKILEYLNQYQGDGKFYEIESLLQGSTSQEISKILDDLWYDKLIERQCGHITGFDFDEMMAIFNNSNTTTNNQNKSKPYYKPYEGRITLKGISYLNETTKEMDKNNINVNVGNNSTANLIIQSPNSIINNNQEIDNKVQEIINQLNNDNTITDHQRTEAIQTFNQLKDEIQKGSKNSSTIEKVLTVGSEISSIGSFVISLVQLLSS